MWDYVFFRFYLQEKDPIEFTGLETYCYDAIKEQKITWLPLKKAIVIEGLWQEAPAARARCTRPARWWHAPRGMHARMRGAH